MYAFEFDNKCVVKNVWIMYEIYSLVLLILSILWNQYSLCIHVIGKKNTYTQKRETIYKWLPLYCDASSVIIQWYFSLSLAWCQHDVNSIFFCLFCFNLGKVRSFFSCERLFSSFLPFLLFFFKNPIKFKNKCSSKLFLD